MAALPLARQLSLWCWIDPYAPDLGSCFFILR
jgi:hypothetical protein